jgi:hypothetical protein
MPHRVILTAAILATVSGLWAQKPNPGIQGIPPRTAPADYQYHAQAGNLTVAAEFTGHSVGTPEGPLTTEDYVVFEVAVYGPAGARTTLAARDFSLRFPAKKPIMAQPYGLVVPTLKDFQLEPTASEQKSKTSVGTGGQSESSSTPAPFKVPPEIRRSWGQRLQKASLEEGDRALPQAGLIYFPYRGKTEKIQSMELVYTGPSGQCTLTIEP